MTSSIHPRQVATTGPWHATRIVLAVVGLLAAAIGAWLQYAPADGVLKLFGWEWDAAELHEAWPAWLLIGGGVVTAASMTIESAHDWVAQRRGAVWIEAVVLAVGVAAFVTGLVVLF